MSDGTNRRKTILIEKRAQWRMVVEQAWPAALTMLITAFVMCFFVARVASEAMEASVELPSLPFVLVTAIAFVVLSIALILYCALRFSHRVAGPVYSIRRSLRAFQDGDTDARVSLRTDDFLTELTDDLNAVLDNAAEYAAEARRGEPAADASTAHVESKDPAPAHSIPE